MAGRWTDSGMGKRRRCANETIRQAAETTRSRQSMSIVSQISEPPLLRSTSPAVFLTFKLPVSEVQCRERLAPRVHRQQGGSSIDTPNIEVRLMS